MAFGATFGGAIGPTLAGSIFDTTGSYTVAFLLCAAVSIAGIMLLVLLKPVGWKEGINDSRKSA